MPPSHAIRREPRSGHRADVQGLRGIAVLAVLLFHAGVPGLGGGFTGVDVFFVISGFLITGNLVREHRAEGRIHLGRFFMRRIVRLVPAAAATVLGTVTVAALVLPPLDRIVLRPEALASLLGLENLWLARTGTDYLATHVESPFQQFWSLGVEEQFYLFWATALALSLAVRAVRRFLVTIMLVGCSASFVAMLWLSSESVPWAFFSPVTRLWELGAGALLAVVTARSVPGRPGSEQTSRVWSRTALPAGLALIVGSAVLLDADLPYPGPLALVPVTGAVLVLAGADRTTAIRRALASRPLTWVGDRSYSLYLVHWPVMVLWSLAADRPLGPVEMTIALAASTVLAFVSHALLEQRAGRGAHARRTRTRARRSLTLVAAVAAVVIPATAVPALHGTETAPVAMADAVLRGPWAPRSVPANLTPSIVTAADSLPGVYDDGCHADFDATTTKGCRFGSGATTTVLFGDSHAAQWFSPLRSVTARDDASLVTMTKSSCPSTDLTVRAVELGREYRECDAWRHDAIRRIAELQPDRVVLSNAANSYRDDADAGTWRAALERTIRTITDATSAEVVVLGDTPWWEQTPNRCLSGSVDDVAGCSRATDTLTVRSRSAAQRAAASATASRFVDPVPWICGDRCDPVLWNVLVYRDANHITDTMARALAPRLAEALGARRATP
ncbi:acyltransferase [Curtobacterium flaccumfaciens pv. oortii]|uniref:acyltransferase family protein n=1 Tax=Curtobacterium flaccumfaciens TaxID=2035 RepID=UPI001BDEC7E7|nr:acyltransferase family protein [Curtobacterium flaccumfaciens]MBT1623364.1 acyltransferase [Curtobacterium flaccumfaciens pv. oortii]